MNYDAKIDPAEAEGASPDSSPQAGDNASRQAHRRMWVFAIGAGILLIAFFFLMHGGKPADFSPENASQTPIVTVISPGRATISGRINATGTLAARREEPVGVQGEGGKVVRVLVEPGQWVGAGQVLAVIDRSVQSEQSAALAAQIEVASAEARLAQANLDRALKLVDRGFISKADVDRLTATRDGADARVRVARAQLGEMQARVRQLNIAAPSAGLVLERNVEPGQVVGAGSGVLFRLARGGEMELLAQLSEEDLARVSPGIPALVTPVGSDRNFNGEVWQVSPVIDARNRQGTARIALSYAPELRPGGFASVEIAAGTTVAPLLPESAVLADNKGSYVFIVGADNKVARRPVRTGAITDEGIVIAEGLTGAERIVRRAGAFLSEGETVRPKVSNSPGS